MILATLKTEHFEFVAAHASKSSAKAHVVAGFLRHLEQMGSSEQAWRAATPHDYHGVGLAAALEDWYGINTMEISSGVCLRDGEVI